MNLRPIAVIALVACSPAATRLEPEPAEVVLATKGGTVAVAVAGKDDYMKDASTAGVVWTSADPAVATVVGGEPDANGRATATVTAVGSGSTLVTAAIGENVATSIRVAVSLVAKGTVGVPAILDVGGSAPLVLSFRNEKDERVDGTATCTSSAPEIVKVEANTATAVAPGFAKISCDASGVTFDTSVAVLGAASKPLAVDGRTVDSDFAFVMQSVGQVPDVQKRGVDSVKVTKVTIQAGKPRVLYEICGTSQKMEMKLKNSYGDGLVLDVPGACAGKTFDNAALPWNGTPWLPLLVEVDKRGLTLGKNAAITASASAPDTWTLTGAGAPLVLKGGVVQ